MVVKIMGKQKVLITGIAGFAGSHLAEYLLKKGNIEVFGMEISTRNTNNINAIKNKIKIFKCDITKADDVKKVIKEIKPEKIFHLAGQAYVPLSWEKPWETFSTNINGELNIFNAVIEAKINPDIQIACSSEEYGIVTKNEIPIKETNPLKPSSPYAVSKVTQDYLGYQYHISHKLNIIRTRAFNHIGPRQRDSFAISNFAKQIAMIERGKQPSIIRVGNLNSIRDFTDVRDVVQAYWLSTEKCKPGEVYNICSGKGYKIKKVLNILLDLSTVKVKVKEDISRIRPSDVPILIGDNSKFVKQTGWKPKIKFEQTAEDLLNYWRERV